MAASAMEANVAHAVVFRPESLQVIPEVRILLRRVLKMERNSLEYNGEDFDGFIVFRIPTGDTYPKADVLTICAELAQEDLGVRAEVELWEVRGPEDGFVLLRPRQFELQEEDREAAPVGRREFIDMVRPSQGC